jgi:peptidyl-prolyl cis-trans isomerase D
MISWIQNHLIRHGRWIFLSLLALIIVAFVFTIGNTPGCTTDRSGYEENLFYGVDLNSPREREAIIEKVQLSAFLNGQQIRNDQEFQSMLTSRIARLHLADEIGVPAPDQATLTEYIQTKNAFRGPDGEFSADEYTRFVDQIESNPRTEQGLVLEVLMENYRIDQIEEALSGPGYLLPSEALAQTQRNQTEYTLETAQLSYADFSPEIDASEAVLRDYYETNQLSYEIPERIRASYVFFDESNYLDPDATFGDSVLREHFIANRAQFVEDFEAAQESAAEAESSDASTTDAADAADETDEAETPSVTFDDVREAVAESYRAERARRMANEAAQNFAFKLYRDAIPLDSAAFNTTLNQAGLGLTRIEPYTLQGASQRALPADLLESAFALGGNRYYSDPFPLDGGFAVLIYEGRIAPEIPAFEAVESEVRANYRAEEKRRLFNEKGEALKAELESTVGEETAFAEAAEALGLSVQSFEPFTPRQAPPGLNRSALQQAQRMQAGEISPMITAGNNGLFVNLIDKAVPEITADDEELTQAEDFLARFSAFSSSSAFQNELIVRGLPESSPEE